MGLGSFHFSRAEGKFFQEAAAGSFVVCPFNISKTHGLTSVFCANPVGIGQIHSNGRGRRSISRFTGHIHCLVADAHDIGLFVFVQNAAVVLEPLHILADHLHARRSIKILDLYNILVGSAHAHRIVVHFYKADNVVDISLCCLGPQYIVFVPVAQISSVEVLDQFDQRCLLGLIFSNF